MLAITGVAVTLFLWTRKKEGRVVKMEQQTVALDPVEKQGMGAAQEFQPRLEVEDIYEEVGGRSRNTGTN